MNQPNPQCRAHDPIRLRAGGSPRTDPLRVPLPVRPTPFAVREISVVGCGRLYCTCDVDPERFDLGVLDDEWPLEIDSHLFRPLPGGRRHRGGVEE